MHFDSATALLDPGSLPYTSGVERLDDGVVHVAVLTRMPGVTPAMFEWWFAEYLQTTEHYKRWHPRDHVWMDWEDKRPGTHLGAKHLVHEYIGGRMNKLRIAFEAAEESLGPDFAKRAPGAVAVCARTGFLEQPLDIGRLIHLATPTPWGCDLHSRFWLGMVSPRGDGALGKLAGTVGNQRWARQRSVNEGLGRALFVHCHEEMETLASFLPQLYESEQA